MKINLPVGIQESDLKYPSYKSKDSVARFNFGTETFEELAKFDLWYTEKMGWCIPTLLI